MNIILTSNRTVVAIDKDHVFICIGQNCCGISVESAEKAHKNAKANAPRGAKRFITYVAPNSVQVDAVDGSLQWPASHNAKDCHYCTCGKGIRVSIS